MTLTNNISTVCPVITCIGRPNVGKSTLFNRFLGRRIALTSPEPGMTRDLREHDVEWMGLTFKLVDTPGLLGPDSSQGFEGDLLEIIEERTRLAFQKADVLLFMLDGKEGITPLDYELARFLRRQNIPIILILNKTENDPAGMRAYELFELGIEGEIVAISAEHGLGLGDLYHALLPYFPKRSPEEGWKEEANKAHEEQKSEPRPIKLSIMGRPNVGKSTLTNALLGEERLVTADFPGVTRDSITVSWTYRDRMIDLIDTAGLRRVTTGKMEKRAAWDAKRTLQYTDVVILVLDASQMMDRSEEALLEKQDLALMHEIFNEGRVLIVALNKWDLVKDPQRFLKAFQQQIETYLPQARGLFWVEISSHTEHNLLKLMDQALQAYDLWCRRINTGTLNIWLKEQLMHHPLPMESGRRLRIKYMTQHKTRPPTFLLFASKADKIPETYLRFLINRLREDFDWPGVPLRFSVRASRNPYVRS